LLHFTLIDARGIFLEVEVIIVEFDEIGERIEIPVRVDIPRVIENRTANNVGTQGTANCIIAFIVP